MTIVSRTVYVVSRPSVVVSLWLACVLGSCYLIRCSFDILPSDLDGILDLPAMRHDRRDYPHNPADRRNHGVHVVVSHCDKPIGWISRRFAEEQRQRWHHRQGDYSLESVTILTKCNQRVDVEGLLGVPGRVVHTNDTANTKNSSGASSSPLASSLVQVVKLENHGRCDHSYAYWIQEVLKGTTGRGLGGENVPSSAGSHPARPRHELLYPKHNGTTEDTKPMIDPFRRIAEIIDPSDIVLFLKDNDNSYRGVAMDDSIGFLDAFDNLLVTSRSYPADTYTNLKRSAFARPVHKGVACQSYPKAQFKKRSVRMEHWFTNLAHRSVLWTFRLENYVRLDRDDPSGKYKKKHKKKRRFWQPAQTVEEEPYDPKGFRSEHRPMGAWIQHLGNDSAKATKSSSGRSASVFSKGYHERIVRGVIDTPGGYYWNATTEGLPVIEDEDPGTWDFRYEYNTRWYTEPDIVPICYGGVFATYWGQLAAEDAPLTPRGWERVVEALSRADNIEEGHYMERWWGDLLSWSAYASTRGKDDGALPPPSRGTTLSEAEQAVLLRDKLRHFSFDNPYAGMVVLDGLKLAREGFVKY